MYPANAYNRSGMVQPSKISAQAHARTLKQSSFTEGCSRHELGSRPTPLPPPLPYTQLPEISNSVVYLARSAQISTNEPPTRDSHKYPYIVKLATTYT